MPVPRIKVSDAAALLGVSDDTLRRWSEGGRIGLESDGKRMTVDAVELAGLASEIAAESHLASVGPKLGATSARNRIPGIVTRVLRDGIMAQVEIQAGPFRMVSLMSREAADELGLEPGRIASATVKATNVVIEASPNTETGA